MIDVDFFGVNKKVMVRERERKIEREREKVCERNKTYRRE